MAVLTKIPLRYQVIIIMYEMQYYFDCNPLVDIRSNFCVLLYTLHSYEMDVTKVTNE